jgi:copper resistance protein C
VTTRALRMAAALLVLMPSAIGPAWAHVFPDHSEPRVGRVLDAPPPAVRVWFDGQIEPAFSTLRVEDATQRRVDRNDARVDGNLLQVSLPPLPAGRYRVYWSVVARDGHRTEGSFPFRVR